MKARILVVEDEAHLAEIIGDNLTMEGYEVLRASDGNEALSVWRREPLDLILLDVMMPKVSGFEVCETIRKGGGLVPILFLTAKDASSRSRRRCSSKRSANWTPIFRYLSA